MKDPKSMEYEDMYECLRTIQATLWPDGDEAFEGSAETLDKVRGIMHDGGIGKLTKPIV